MSTSTRYWDANAFLGWLNDEQDKAQECESVLAAADAGKVQIVTSALTLTEVIKLKGKPRLTKDKEEAIKAFFENDYIIVRDVDRFIAEKARDLIWSFNGLHPKDAIHVATAVILKINVLDTFDGRLIKLSGKIGAPKLIIAHPHMLYQPDMYESRSEKSKS
ncbi:MAG: type II toxin-antitoxin system VapC family toxin [Acidobacteriota bacterium]|nr:type II toxin-antitoxin system VapC family toxin [Acidobacteriota bacterium]